MGSKDGDGRTVVVPESASEAKLAAVRRLGAAIEKVSQEEFFETFATRERRGVEGLFIHAFSDRDVMAGGRSTSCTAPCPELS